MTDTEITDEDCKIVNGEWHNERCYPKHLKEKHQISYRRASGAIERIPAVPTMILDDVVEVLYNHGSVYDVQVEGLPYFKYHHLFGGTVKPDSLEESRRDVEILKSRWKSHKQIRGKDIGG